MTDPKAAWQEVGDKLESLALKLKMHVKEEASEAEAGGGEDERTNTAIQRVLDAVGEAFEGLGDAVRDPNVRADVRAAADAFGRAIETSFEQVRKRT